MINIRERELKEVLKDFKSKDIIIEFDDGIEGIFKMRNASIIYDEEEGYINIVGNENSLKINTTIIYRYMVSEDYKSFKIKIDSQISLKINNT